MLEDPKDQALAELKASEARLRLALDAGRMAVWDYEIRSDSVTGTADLKVLLGLPPGDEINLDAVRAAYYPGERERMQLAGQEALARGERFFEVEFRYLRSGHDLRWFLLRAEIVMGEDSQPERVVGVLMDITGRKRAEEEREKLTRQLADREAELTAALDAASLAVFDFDHVAKVVNRSRRFNEFFGYPADHVPSIEDIRARYHPDYRENMQEIIRGMEQPDLKKMSMELRLLMPDGSSKWIQGLGEYIRDEEGRPIRSRGVVMDVTERKVLEETQRLLISELGHRIKNTLAIIDAIMNQTFRVAESKEEAQGMLRGRLSALAQAHQLLTGSNWRSAPLKAVLDGALAAHRDGSGRIAASGPDVDLNARQALSLTLAVHELATNAVKYGALSNDAGSIDIEWMIGPASEGVEFRWRWTEKDGPEVKEPERAGFGSRMLQHALAHDFGGTTELTFDAQGVSFELVGVLATTEALP